jgi:GNAT superfamily N-acetyltransferase
MPLKLIDFDTKEYRQMVDLRLALLRKPLGLNFTEDELRKEKNDIHIGFFDDHSLEGCCMLTEVDPYQLRLRQMAVSSGLQGKGIGRSIMQFAENVARDRGYKIMTMHARKNAVGFYEKLGYQVEGTEFIEVTIPHYIMTKEL